MAYEPPIIEILISVLIIASIAVLWQKQRVSGKENRETFLTYNASFFLTFYPILAMSSYLAMFTAVKYTAIGYLILLTPIGFYLWRKRKGRTQGKEGLIMITSYPLHIFLIPFGITGLAENYWKKTLK